jgi:heme oxygenase (biliverdin-IX-beta and delta-forming)
MQVNRDASDMPADDSPSRSALAADARAVLRRALKGALATRDADTGYPYASLLTLATDMAGAPVFLISTLARHTRNLAADPRASILIDETDGLGDPLAGARLSLRGRAETIDDADAARRFAARHASAAGYAGFSDFRLWRLKPEGGHYIGGFGRIVDFVASDLLTDLDGAEGLIAAEAGIVAHMNDDHADAVELYATRLLGAEPGAWRMVACDPQGCDLLLGGRALRLCFDSPVKTAEEARQALVALVRKARAEAA